VTPKVSVLFERLDASNIRYCHWKSNWVLAETLAAETDIDLLVKREDAQAFRAVLEELGFRPAIEVGVPPFPSVEHHLALDEAEGAIVHVHAYYRVISGESLTKNYRLPLEEMLLTNVMRAGAVNVPRKGAELVIFVLRMSLKHATLAELTLLLRGWDDVRREASWLATDEARGEARELLIAWLPAFSPDLFDQALEGLLEPARLWRRIVVGRRVRGQLRQFARRGRLRAWGAGVRAFTGKAMYHLRGTRKRLTLGEGGAVIAFVGAEATGKSTVLTEMERWLGRYLTVQRVHAGKPPSTPLTVVPNLLLPLLRSLVPGQRSTRVAERRHSAGRGPCGATEDFPLLFGIRSVLLAHDRKVLLTRVFASAVNGSIVLCDRYPSADNGAPDGAQLSSPGATTKEGGLRRWLVEREARLYRTIVAPDLAIYLTAPLETTLERNRNRQKVEPEEYVRSRHQRSSNLRFDGVPVRKVRTDRPLDEVLAEIRKLIWDVL
jgi:thymidylate kinase